ncbi:MAG: phage antirepressor KilAC domain-containing protein [Methylococcales bacterium]|nr:phage antirepressor KilAC domain-containing protein [Methylococcales bacterium]
MNNLSIQNQQTMSSVEIVKIINDMREEGAAELRHDNFTAKVVTVLGSVVALNFQGYYKASNGKQNPCYYLPKRETHLMVMSENYKVQAAVYDRMAELEQQAAKPIDPMELFSDAAAMLQLATNYAKRIIEQDEVIAEQAPKVAALARLSEAEGSFNVTESAKALGIQRDRLFSWLKANGWIYRRAGSKNWLGYHDKDQRGYLTHKVHSILLPNGTERISEQVRITPKGLTKLAKVFSVGATGVSNHA